MQITQTQDSGYTVYKFTANNTEYDVLTRNGVEFDVYSSRIGLTGRTPPKCYDSLEELAKRSKVFKNFSLLIG